MNRCLLLVFVSVLLFSSFTIESFVFSLLRCCLFVCHRLRFFLSLLITTLSTIRWCVLKKKNWRKQIYTIFVLHFFRTFRFNVLCCQRNGNWLIIHFQCATIAKHLDMIRTKIWWQLNEFLSQWQHIIYSALANIARAPFFHLIWDFILSSILK